MVSHDFSRGLGGKEAEHSWNFPTLEVLLFFYSCQVFIFSASLLPACIFLTSSVYDEEAKQQSTKILNSKYLSLWAHFKCKLKGGCLSLAYC